MPLRKNGIIFCIYMLNKAKSHGQCNGRSLNILLTLLEIPTNLKRGFSLIETAMVILIVAIFNGAFSFSDWTTFTLEYDQR